MLLLALGGQQLLARPSALDSSLIRLKSVTFDPQAGEPAIPQSLRAPMTGGQGTYLLQFNGPVQDDWKGAVEQAGARLYGYIPDYAFIARIDAAALTQLRALPFVRWVGPYHPAYRLAPSLAQATAAGEVRVMAQTLPDADQGALAARDRRLGRPGRRPGHQPDRRLCARHAAGQPPGQPGRAAARCCGSTPTPRRS